MNISAFDEFPTEQYDMIF